jgi:hypothetical protein
LGQTAKSAATVLEDQKKKENPSVYRRPKHRHWEKKAEPQRLLESVVKILTLIARVRPRM